MMLHTHIKALWFQTRILLTKYQGSMPSGFSKEDFFSSRKSIFSLCDLDMQGTRTI